MANTVTGWFETLTAGVSEASKTLYGTNSLLDSVYTDYRSEEGRFGQTIDVVIPASTTASVASVASGDGSLTDISNPFVAVTLDTHYQYAFVIRDFEQVRSGGNILQGNIESALGGVQEKVNNSIAALLTTGNFTTNGAIAATGSKLTNLQILAGRTKLINQKVPMNIAANVSLVVNGDVHSGVLGDSTLSSAQIASDQIAYGVHAGAVLPTLYGATLKYDQSLDSLTTGTSPSRTFTGALFHKYAIAMVSAPMPKPIGSAVEYSYVYYKGIPIRVTVGYERGKIGNVVQFDVAFGVKVVRENLGVLYAVAES